MAWYFEAILGIVAFGLFVHYYYKSKHSFWKDLGVNGPKPLAVVGNTLSAIFAKVSLADYIKKLYDDWENVPMIGLYRGATPILIVRDPELIRSVLVKNFSKFADRGIPIAEKTEPLTQNLFALEPARWRALRNQFTPVFSTGKLKDMFLMILDCADNLEKYIATIAGRDEECVDIRDLTAKFTTDVIGTCAFGIDTKSLGDEDSEFRRMGKSLFTPSYVKLLRFRMREFVPTLYNSLGYILPQLEVTKFFVKLTMDTIKYRKEQKIVRNDFINALLELYENPHKVDIKLTDGLIASQSFVFFAAGFETSSSTMSNALYELALNQDLQNKLREEITETYERTNGDLQYETIKQMQLLDRVFKETLRMYPPLAMLFRKTMTEFTFEGTNVTIPKGVKVWIPVYGLHRDAKIYPDPGKFDPDRFTDEAIKSRHPMTYIPFGDGPRNCIGARFAIYQTKIGLIKILRKYKVDVCEKTPIPYINDPKQFLIGPKGGMYLKVTKFESD